MASHRSNPFSILSLVLILICSSLSSSSLFSPADNYLIDCGSPQQTRLSDGRTFKSDRDAASLFSGEDHLVNLNTSDDNLPKPSPGVPPSSLPLYTTLRLFSGESTYSFHISRPGNHFVRLYFYPIPDPTRNLSATVFRVAAAGSVLLDHFSASGLVFREFLVRASERLSLTFTPKKPNSLAFVNAIEVVSAPDYLVQVDSAAAFEVVYRVNVGGPALGPVNDTLFRTWEPDEPYNAFPEGSEPVSVPESEVRFSSEEWPGIAPAAVYATARRARDPGTPTASFNLTWKMRVDEGFSYFVRLHFYDVVSRVGAKLFFNVYVDGVEAVPGGLDLSSLAGAAAYNRDFVLAAENMTAGGAVVVKVGCSGAVLGAQDALLNGIEVMKMIGRPAGGARPMRVTVAAAAVGVGLGLAAAVFVTMAWQRRRRSRTGPGNNYYSKRNKSFSSWLLPLQGSYSRGSWSTMRSHSSAYFESGGFGGRAFTLAELQAATRGFDEAAVIGAGGFGKVYLGVLGDGTRLAVKRAGPGSEQGASEFRAEIETLSRLRHRHLVSLVGFCDERGEMILVYEYMSNGPLRDRLRSLTWRQRLEACAGAARGLHYLHTGATIIHRDVKSTNILLDDNLVAKVSDFGLSRAAAALDRTHVSTAVKGSFGYLDPEYFRRQQLTEKSDVYSFGVVLLEALCGRAAVDPKLPRDQVSLAEWAMRRHREGAAEAIVDPRIAGSVGDESLRKFVEAAEKCLAGDGADRPSMGDVLWNLEYCIQLQDAASVIAGGESDKKRQQVEIPLLVEGVCDDSSVTMEGSVLFDNQIGHFQGR